MNENPVDESLKKFVNKKKKIYKKDKCYLKKIFFIPVGISNWIQVYLITLKVKYLHSEDSYFC